MADWPAGSQHYPGFLNDEQQTIVLGAIRDIVSRSPLFIPTMPNTGKPFSVRMTNCGSLGWVSSKMGGYRYQTAHPDTGEPWPPIPECLLAIWREVSGYEALPEACLINWYEPGAKMGLHVDRDEENREAPVVSVSLGDDAWFRVGGLKRRDPTQRFLLKSGDVVVLSGASRFAHHGIDRVLQGTSTLRAATGAQSINCNSTGNVMQGRFNLTLRRVTHPANSA